MMETQKREGHSPCPQVKGQTFFKSGKTSSRVLEDKGWYGLGAVEPQRKVTYSSLGMSEELSLGS